MSIILIAIFIVIRNVIIVSIYKTYSYKYEVPILNYKIYFEIIHLFQLARSYLYISFEFHGIYLLTVMLLLYYTNVKLIISTL